MPFWRRRAASYRLSGELLLRVQDPPDLGVDSGDPVNLDTDLKIDLLAVRTDDGQSTVPAFTSEEELLAWDPSGGPWVAMDARAAAALAYGSGFDVLVVDPASSSWAFSRADLAALLDAE